MTKVVIKYSVPVYQQDQLLNGTLGNAIRGYHNFAITMWGNVFLSEFSSLFNGELVPSGYFLSTAPSVDPVHKYAGIFRVTTRGESFSKRAISAVILRPLGEATINESNA